MFDELFGTQAKLASAVDTYLDRMKKVLDIKKQAHELNEPKLEEQMNTFMKTISAAAAKVLNDSVAEESDKKGIEEENE